MGSPLHSPVTISICSAFHRLIPAPIGGEDIRFWTWLGLSKNKCFVSFTSHCGSDLISVRNRRISIPFSTFQVTPLTSSVSSAVHHHRTTPGFQLSSPINLSEARYQLSHCGAESKRRSKTSKLPPESSPLPSPSVYKIHHRPGLLFPGLVLISSPSNHIASMRPSSSAVKLHRHRSSPEPSPDLNGTRSGSVSAWLRRLISPPTGFGTSRTLPRPAGLHQPPLATAKTVIAGKVPLCQNVVNISSSVDWIRLLLGYCQLMGLIRNHSIIHGNGLRLNLDSFVLFTLSKPSLLRPNWEMVLYYICPASKSSRFANLAI